MEYEITPCNVHIDIFYKFLLSFSDIRDAIKVLRSCDREEEFIAEGFLIGFCEHFRDSLFIDTYDSLVDLCNKERKLLQALWSDLQFWKDILLYDATIYNKRNINDFFSYCCENGYNIFVGILLSTSHRHSLKRRKFIVNGNEVSYPFNKKVFDPANMDSLVEAAGKGYYLIVKMLLDDGRIDPTDYNNIATIDEATNNGHIEVVKLLLLDDRLIEANMHEVALNIAYENDDQEMVKMIMETADIDQAVYKNLELMTAILQHDVVSVKKFLEDPEVDPSVITNDVNLLSMAISMDNEKIVKILLEDGRINPNTNDLFSAVSANYTKIVKLLLEDGRVNPSINNNYIIKQVVSKGYIKIVKLLLEDGRADPSARHNYPIRIAAKKGHYKIVKLLLEDHRVDPSDRNNAAYNNAVAKGHAKIVKLLLKDERVRSKL